MPDPGPRAGDYDALAARQELGRHLRDLRVSREWNQQELADRVGMSLSSLSAYERGTRSLSLETLVSICRVFDLLVSDFLSGIYPYGCHRRPERPGRLPG